MPSSSSSSSSAMGVSSSSSVPKIAILSLFISIICSKYSECASCDDDDDDHDDHDDDILNSPRRRCIDRVVTSRKSQDENDIARWRTFVFIGAMMRFTTSGPRGSLYDHDDECDRGDAHDDKDEYETSRRMRRRRMNDDDDLIAIAIGLRSSLSSLSSRPCVLWMVEGGRRIGSILKTFVRFRLFTL